jgi:CRISPR-associated protein Csm3
MKLKEIREITGTIKVITGLHIGKGNDEIQIGGVDNLVIRNPMDEKPYIPGSSIKGKLRFLTEWTSGCVDSKKGEPFAIKKKCENPSEEAKNIVKIFGNGSPDELDELAKELLQPRLYISDAFLSKESSKNLLDKLGSYTETKYEVAINRLTGKSAQGLRQIERVPAGAVFDFYAIYKMFFFDNKDKQIKEEETFNFFYEKLDLLNYTGLGGGASRGNGRIELTDKNCRVIYPTQGDCK